MATSLGFPRKGQTQLVKGSFSLWHLLLVHLSSDLRDWWESKWTGRGWDHTLWLTGTAFLPLFIFIGAVFFLPAEAHNSPAHLWVCFYGFGVVESGTFLCPCWAHGSRCFGVSNKVWTVWQISSSCFPSAWLDGINMGKWMSLDDIGKCLFTYF